MAEFWIQLLFSRNYFRNISKNYESVYKENNSKLKLRQYRCNIIYC